MQDILDNIVDHLYISRACPECGTGVNVSLSQMLTGGSLECPECGTELEFEADQEMARRIEGLAAAYDGLADLLGKRHMPLLLHE
jgi:endogenous inhibitor of DNA gyrase (YacG/DUF329 family)